MPTNSIPINLGSVVSDMRKPPKFAATVNQTKLNNCPPGAADGPMITNAVTHIKTPKLQRK